VIDHYQNQTPASVSASAAIEQMSD